jgi:hypothetical protein
MANDDVLFAYRLRVLASAGELGSVAAVCQMCGLQRLTSSRCKAMIDRFGLEILPPRERQRSAPPACCAPQLHRTGKRCAVCLLNDEAWAWVLRDATMEARLAPREAHSSV